MEITLTQDEHGKNNELASDRTLARCAEAITALGYHAGRSGASVDVPESLVAAFAERHTQRHWSGRRTELAKRRTEAEQTAREVAITKEKFERSCAYSTRWQDERE